MSESPERPLQAELPRDLRAAEIDVHALRALLGSTSIRERIERDVRLGAAMGVHNTPTWFFNGELWEGQHDRETLLVEVHRALGATI